MYNDRETPMKRCPWCEGFELYRDYHDTEWGVPVRDDRTLFELLILEGAQAGLSWSTVLKKRENYREAFDDFNPDKIAQYGDAKVLELLTNPGIIRNKLKISATVTNARAYLTLQESGHAFGDFVWQFVDYHPIKNKRLSMSEVPAKTAASDAMSKALLKAGFKFVGSTICYAFMQASGMVNDHLVDCHRYSNV